MPSNGAAALRCCSPAPAPAPAPVRKKDFFAWLKSLFGFGAHPPSPRGSLRQQPWLKAMRAAMAAVMAEAVKDVADAADGMAPAMVRATPPAPGNRDAAGSTSEGRGRRNECGTEGRAPAMATAALKVKNRNGEDA